MIALLVLAILALVAFDAWAQASARTPFDPALLVTYTWVIALAMMGGMANFIRKVKRGEARPFNLVELVGELVISASAGIITYFLCQWAGVNEWLTAALVGISGHAGSRFFFMGERALERWLDRLFGVQQAGNIEK